MLYAVNVRPEQRFGEALNLVLLRKERTKRALELLDHEFVFYQPREKTHGTYLGIGVLISVMPEDDSPFCVLEFDDLQMFTTAPKVNDMRAFIPGEEPQWYEFAQPIRDVPVDIENYLRELLGIPSGTSEATLFEDSRRASRTYRVRNPRLRYDVLETYGSRCVFSGTVFCGLTLGRVATQVGHLVPLRNGGADEISNALPMSPLANWLWDEGVISLNNLGEILISRKACTDTRTFIRPGTSIPFKDPKTWPRPEYLSWHRDNIFEQGPSSALNWMEP
jgi:hypothetical protein